MKDHHWHLLLAFIVGILAITSVFLLIAYAPSIKMFRQDCDSMRNIEDIVNCEVSKVNTFYIYNQTDDSRVLTLDDLKARGGDCKDWSTYYLKIFTSHGLNATFIPLHIEDNLYHDFILVHDSRGYCRVDLREYDCTIYKR